MLTATATPKSSATFEQTLRDAEMIASLNPAWSIHRTAGESMGDYFGDNSLIIVQEADIEQIEVGMMVVYRSAKGELISHKVVAHDGDSIRTAGSANWKIDPEPVTSEMIIGTIFAVFHSEGAPSGPALTSNGQAIPTALCKSH